MKELSAYVTSIERIQHALNTGGDLSSLTAYFAFVEGLRETASQENYPPRPYPFFPFADRFTGGGITNHMLGPADRTPGSSPRNEPLHPQ
jgi:hypothetical protein